MKNSRRMLLYCVFLGKRFLKKPVFLILLCTIPLLALGLRIVSAEDSGMVHILLAVEDTEDQAVQEMVQKLLEADSVIRYTLAKDGEEAEKLVKSGQADAAWIFRSGFQEKAEKLIRNGKSKREDSPVLVIEQEENVLMHLSRIRLFGAIYPSLSFSLFQDFVQADLGLGENLTEEELRGFYEENRIERQFFQRAWTDSGEAPQPEKGSYMTAPLRGMLILVILLCGLAADMFFLQDEEQGVLDSVPMKVRDRLLYMYQLAAMIPAAAAVLPALFLAGDFMAPGRELLLMLLYLPACMVFCKLIKRLCVTAKLLGTCIPLLMLAMFALTPVFFSIGILRSVQYLLPPFYYLTEAFTGGVPTGIILYTLLGLAADICIAGSVQAGRKLRSSIAVEKRK